MDPETPVDDVVETGSPKLSASRIKIGGSSSEEGGSKLNIHALRRQTGTEMLMKGLVDIATDVGGVLTPGVRQEDVYPWANVVLIAIIIGVVEFLPFLALAVGIETKYKLLHGVVEDDSVGMMALYNVLASLGFVTAAVLVVSTAPCVSGSGIPPLIAYLYNGVLTHPDFLSVKAALVKMVAVVLALLSGLVMGREGPAIHIGAAIGDLTNRLINQAMYQFTGEKVEFDGNTKANVVMMGSAAGFASAFRSPVGGMLYAIEEIATHWDIKAHLTVGAQTFVVVAIAVFINSSLATAAADGSDITFNSIVIFDDDKQDAHQVLFYYGDIIGFTLISIICGISVGYYTKASEYVAHLRSKNLYWKENLWVRVLDACVVVAITATVFSFIPLLWTDCKQLAASGDDHGDDHAGDDHGDDHRRFVQYTCASGEYSQLASLCLSGEEAVIRVLLSRDNIEFGLVSLVIFMIFYVPLSLLVFGLPIPMGTFVPNLLLGSLTGRIVGEVVQSITHHSHSISVPGVYALVGAASQLGAWTRTMIAVVVTLIEITGDVGLVVPLICSVVLARGIATSISHHSYTHSQFYELVDDPNSDKPKILHPTDWENPKGPNLRVRRTNSFVEVDNERNRALTINGDHGAVNTMLQKDGNGTLKVEQTLSASRRPSTERRPSGGYGALTQHEVGLELI